MANHQHGKMAAILGRWQPVHLGHVAALVSVCDHFTHVRIGIGSANRYDYRNPFHPAEVEQMLNMVLKGYANYELIPVADTPDDDAWCLAAGTALGSTDVFYTANPYVYSLLKDQFNIAHPATIIPQARKVPVSATMVRKALARGIGWRELLPEKVAAFIADNQLDDRFRQDFGLQTLTMETIIVR